MNTKINTMVAGSQQVPSGWTLTRLRMVSIGIASQYANAC